MHFDSVCVYVCVLVCFVSSTISIGAYVYEALIGTWNVNFVQFCRSVYGLYMHEYR